MGWSVLWSCTFPDPYTDEFGDLEMGRTPLREEQRFAQNWVGV
jgi:hypothetical protein